MTILYNAGELTTEKCIFTRYKGTMVKMVMTSPAFWILNSLHGVCLIVDRWSESYQIPQMDWKAFHMISPLIGFFLVFYTGRSYARLTTFYEQIIGMDNSCMNWAAMVHNNLPGDADVKWNCIRLLLASMREQLAHTLPSSATRTRALRSPSRRLHCRHHLLHVQRLGDRRLTERRRVDDHEGAPVDHRR